MTARRWDIDVARVVVRGADARGLDSASIRRLVEAALVDGLREAPLPAGRAHRSEVVIPARSPGAARGPDGLARSVAGGVIQAVTGRTAHG